MNKYILKLSFVLVLNFSSAYSADLMTFKLINGLVDYESDALSGSSTTIVSPGLGYYKIVNEKTLVGINLDIFFSLTTQSVSLLGIGTDYQYYFIGNGGAVHSKTNEIEISATSKWALYGSLSLKRYSYFLGSNKLEEIRYDQNGNFFNFDLGLGANLEIGDRSSLFLMVTKTFISLASSDDRIKFRTTFLSFGISKEF